MNRLPFIRRWLYTGRRGPQIRRPHAAWPPPQDPWMQTAETQLIPPVSVYERKEQ